MLAWDSFSRHNSFSRSSSGTSSPKSLSIYTSSPASSYTTPDDQLSSPLPSPRDPPPAAGNKTNAFFSSPFTSAGPPTPVPPPPPSRATTLVPDTPKLSSEQPSSSATYDFFSNSTTSSLLTPPPSVRSPSRSRDHSPPRLPPLARFFPHRYSSTTDSKREEKGMSWETDLKRELMKQFTEANVKSQAEWLSSPTDEPLFMVTSSSPSASASSSPPAPFRNLPTRSNSRSTRSKHLERASFPSLKSDDFHAPERSTFDEELREGMVVGGLDIHLTLVRELGQGAFSSVWSARSADGLLDPHGNRPVSESWAKRREDTSWTEGLRPPAVTRTKRESERREGSIVLDELFGEGASSSGTGIGTICLSPSSSITRTWRTEPPEGRLVAVKMVPRAVCDTNDQTRISFVREVEVLRHIAHPSIVAYLHSFTTPSHHCLVLEHIGGGELFDLINSNEQYARLTEPVIRRMWGELCKAVGWMHGVALVHRDIKLENILLTSNIFDQPPSDTDPLSLLPPSNPLIKLTDFGLSRFIDPASPLLTTRCGSEAYAAPELVMGGTRGYDARQTDAWACGVVLYALATRELPFDPTSKSSYSSKSSTSAESHSVARQPHPHISDNIVGHKRRKEMLHRIVNCEYSWPEVVEELRDDINEEGPLNTDLTPEGLATDGIKKVVSRLLVRDPTKRARMVELWDEDWMQGEGASTPPLFILRRRQSGRRSLRNGELELETEAMDDDLTPSLGYGQDRSYPDWNEEYEFDDDDGMLVDRHSIDDVARQELQPS